MFTDWYTNISIALIILLLVMLVDKMGNGVVLRESTAVLYAFSCLIVPLLGYQYYTMDNPLAWIWRNYMPIPKNVYFAYALPAISCFCLAITWPIGLKTTLDEGAALNGLVVQIKKIVNHKAGLVIMGLGILVSLIIRSLPAGLQFFATLIFFGSFAGLLYLFYSTGIKYRKIIIIAFIAFIFSNALKTGMFTIVVYMSVTIFSFFLLGSKTSLVKKLLLLSFAIVFILVLQNVKLAYRKFTWQSEYEGNKVELFAKLFVENIQKGDALLDNKAFFPIYSRTNQGFNVSLVMRRIPAIQPYDNGDKLFTVFLSSFVPRFLWPDKPEAGGKFNMAYYTGWIISGFSTNVGPLGEAYGSFGVTGGIIYMFFLGLFIRWVYQYVFIFAKKNPLLICWLPVLFFQITYSAETDTLQILNSLVKSAFFLWLLVKFLPSWFSLSKNQQQPGIQSQPKVLSQPA